MNLDQFRVFLGINDPKSQVYKDIKKVHGLVKRSLKQDSSAFIELMDKALIAEKYLKRHKNTIDLNKFTLLLKKYF